MESYLERIDLPDGQTAELLTRLPKDRADSVQKALERERIITRQTAAAAGLAIAGGVPYTSFQDAVLRAHLWSAKLKDYLTGEDIGVDQVGRADPQVVDLISTRAIELYIAWSQQAYPKAPNTQAPSAPATEPEKPAQS